MWLSKTEQGYGLQHMASSQRLSGGRVSQLHVPAAPGQKPDREITSLCPKEH